MLVLASSSPRRRELLGQITRDFIVVPPDTDEATAEGLSPEGTVRTLALRKARAVHSSHPGQLVIGADTVVALGGTILGKPVDEADAARMLALLSGASHSVYTGIAICSKNKEEVFHVKTVVTFRELTAAEILAYSRSGEPMGKAGGYAIQGNASAFVSRLEGSLSNVVGLPVEELQMRLSLSYSIG